MEKTNERTLQELREMLAGIIEAAIAATADRAPVADTTVTATCEDASAQETCDGAEDAAAQNDEAPVSAPTVLDAESEATPHASPAESSSEDSSAAEAVAEAILRRPHSPKEASSVEDVLVEGEVPDTLSGASELPEAEPLPGSPSESTPQWSAGCIKRPPRRPVRPSLTSSEEEPASAPAQDSWAELLPELNEVREQRRKVTAAERAAFEKFNGFIRRYGLEGEETAGKWLVAIRDHQGGLRAADEWKAEARERHRIKETALEEEKEARRKLAELALIKEEQLKLENETKRQLNLAINRQRCASSLPPRCRLCPVCGYEKVSRGRECPRRELHPGWTSR